MSILLFCFLSAPALAQFYSSGQEPASQKWYQLQTQNISVVFPAGHETTAKKFAALLQNNISASSQNMGIVPKPIPVWLHMHSLYSNGFVAWAPDRMEIYSVPPQDSYAQQWLPQLAVHEYRHVVQLNALNQGFTKGLSYVFGQQATGAVLGLYLPMWFMEGDAVSNETALTKAGRGRQPAFEKYLKTQLLREGLFSYAKATFGSYRDFVPNRYELGYYLVAQAYKDYGTDFWKHVVQNVARNPWQITPFSRGIKQQSEKNKWQWYQGTMDTLKADWQKEGFEPDSLDQHRIKTEKKFYCNITKPVITSDGAIMALFRPKAEIDFIGKIPKDGSVQKIFRPGYYLPDHVSLTEDYFLYAEIVPDLRWSNRSYSRIVLYNFSTERKTALTAKGRWYSPSLSADRKKLLAIRLDENSKSALHIRHLKEEKAQDFYPPHSLEISEPVCLEKLVYLFAVSEKGKGIMALNPENGHWNVIIPFGKYNLSHLSADENQLVFTASFNGLDQVYSYHLKTKKLYQLTQEPFAADFGTIKNDSLIYSGYTKNGFSPIILSVAKNTLKEAKASVPNFPLAEAISDQRPLKFSNDTVLHEEYRISRYRKFPHLFDFHSWGPISVDAGSYEVKPGFSVQSQNLLSTSFFSAGYEYEINDEYGIWFADYTYKGWYPELSLRAEYSRPSRKLEYEGNYYDCIWNQYSLESKAALPFHLSRGRYGRFLQLETGYNYTLFDDAASSQLLRGRQEYHILDYRLYFSNLRKKTELDMYARFGQVLDLNLRTLPFHEGGGSLYAAESYFYLPALARHHGLGLYAAYQQRNSNGDIFSSVVSYPRGISGQRNEKLWSFHLNYKMPLAYPDWTINGLLYLKRLKATFFFDYARGFDADQWHEYKTIGAELNADLHLFEMIAPMDVGLRSIYLPEAKNWRFEFLLRIDFVSLY